MAAAVLWKRTLRKVMMRSQVQVQKMQKMALALVVQVLKTRQLGLWLIPMALSSIHQLGH